jgi:stress-induced-phosphoprotein 1
MAKAWALMGRAYRGVEDFAFARVFLKKALQLFCLPGVADELQKVHKAIQAIQDPSQAEREKKMGNEFYSRADYWGAINSYSLAIRLNPGDAKLYSNRSICFYKIGQFPEALRDAHECTQIDPKFMRGHLRRGDALIGLEDYLEAAVTFAKALSLDPGNAEATEKRRQCLGMLTTTYTPVKHVYVTCDE